jgi:PAS domain S-box-containing protein
MSAQHWQYTPYALPSILAFLLSSTLAFYVWRQRPTPASTAFSVLMLAIAGWSFGYTLEVAGADLPTKVFWAKFQYLPTTLIPPATLAFGLRYSAPPSWWPSRRALALLSVIPAVTAVLAFTNEMHGLIWSEVGLENTGSLVTLRVVHGAWFLIHITYNYFSVLVTAILIALAAIRSPQFYRRQALILLIATIPTWLANILRVFDLIDVPIDMTPLVFTITGMVMAWGLFRFRLFDIVPVAREAVVERMGDGVMVLDAQGRVVDMNQAAQHIVGLPSAEVLGRKATAVFGHQPGLAGLFAAMAEGQIEFTLGEEDRRRDYDARLSPLTNRAGGVTGWLAVFRDITARKEDERRYESLLAAAQRQSLELTLLDRVRTALAREVELPVVLRTVVESVAETFGYTLVSIYLQENDALLLQYQVGYSQVIERIPITEGVSGQVVRTRKPVLLQDVSASPAFLEAEEGIVSEVCVPLFDQGQVVGVLNVESKSVRLAPADLQLMVALSKQVNVSIGRARLYAEARRQNRLLEGVAGATRCLLKTSNWAEAMNEALAIAGQAADADRVYIFENQAHPQTGEPATSQRFEWTRESIEPQIDNPELQNFPWSAIERWYHLLSAGDTVNGPVWEFPPGERAVLEPQGIRSVLAAPISIGDYFWGFIGFDDCRSERYWSSHEVSVLKTLAASIGNAFERQRAELELRTQRQLFENLVAVARATAERPALEATLQNALNVAARLTAAEHGSLLLADGTGAVTRSILAGDTRPLNAQPPIANHVISRGLAGWVADHKQPALIADTQDDERWLSLPDSPYAARSALAVPILSGSMLLGVLTLAHSQPRHFDDGHLHLMQAAADQMTLALRNAQIFEAQRRMTEQQTILYEVLRALGGQLIPETVTRMAVEAIAQFAGWSHVGISTPSEDRQTVTGWFAGQSHLEPKPVFPASGGIVGRTLRTGQTQYAPDTALDPDYMPLRPRTRSELAVPLKHGGRTLGVLNLESDEPDAFHDDDIRLAESLADAVALALDNAYLHQTIANERSQLQALIKSSRDGAILIGVNHRILVINDAALHLLGIPQPPEAIIGRHAIDVLSLLRRTAPRLAKVAIAGMRRVQAGDESPIEGEDEIPPHLIRWLDLPVTMSNVSLGRLVVMRDVTEERALEKTRDDLTRTMVHDLRNPLAAISGVLSILQEDVSILPEQRQAVEVALDSADRMSSLVNDILDVSRLENKQMPMERKTFALAPLAAEVLKLQTVLANKNGIRLENAIPSGLLAWADAGLISRVLQNLVGNAIKFTPSGGLVRVAASAELNEHSSLLISVSDTGPGIPAEFHERIFQKFFTGWQGMKGSGLGLAFCRLAVEAHGGRIWVESRPGQGATFRFTLPAA